LLISNRTSLPEVADGAALIIEPDNHEEFVSALQKGLEDDEWRINAIADGIAKAKQYTWEKCVNETIDVYVQFGKIYDGLYTIEHPNLTLNHEDFSLV
jgi:alpha-1,3-rhamnosyl/mannosyltransferase